jgi:hypothetical protein
MAVRADVKGGVVLVEHLDILDLSLSGVRFCCTRRLNPGQSVDLALRRGALRVSRRGTVVRSAFVGATRIDGRDHTSYEVAVAFDQKPRDERQLADLALLMEQKRM